MKLSYLLIILLSLLSCNTENEKEKDKIIDSLKLVINDHETQLISKDADLHFYKGLSESYENNLNNIARAQSEKTYVFVVIKYKVTTPGYSRELGIDLPNIEGYINWTPVQEITNFNEDVKYQLMDKAETATRQSVPFGTFGILDRQCYSFSTYAEASKNRELQKSNNH